MVMILSVRADIRAATRDLDRLERKQIPFATAMAVNNLSAMAVEAEKSAIKKEFPSVTPFTLGGVKYSKARKSDPTAIIYLGDIAEQYLAPYISGGKHFLGGKRGLLNPKAINVNQYGNIAKGRLAALKSRANVFVGTIKTRGGQTIGGVFQRGNFLVGKRRPGRTPDKRKIKPQRARLKILIRFTDPQQVRQHLDWFETAQQVIAQNAVPQMDLAMKMALATARP